MLTCQEVALLHCWGCGRGWRGGLISEHWCLRVGLTTCFDTEHQWNEDLLEQNYLNPQCESSYNSLARSGGEPSCDIYSWILIYLVTQASYSFFGKVQQEYSIIFFYCNLFPCIFSLSTSLRRQIICLDKDLCSFYDNRLLLWIVVCWKVHVTWPRLLCTEDQHAWPQDFS